MKKNGRSPGFPGLTGLLIPKIRNNGIEESKSLSRKYPGWGYSCGDSSGVSPDSLLIPRSYYRFGNRFPIANILKLWIENSFFKQLSS
jgi:hypothetical protein